MTQPQEPRGAAPAHLTTEELSECAFSPETAAASLLEHAGGCARCAAELTDLRLVLTELAALPEPALPESVGIRLDAALARAWQEADAEAEAAAGAQAAARLRRRPSWRKIALPLASLSLIVLAAVGVGALVHDDSPNGAAASSNAQGVTQGNAPYTEGSMAGEALSSWVHDVLSGSTQPKKSAMAQLPHCAADAVTPKPSGYTVLTTAQKVYEGKSATLVVYQSTQKPAPTTVFAMVYAGFCPSATSAVLAQGTVSR